MGSNDKKAPLTVDEVKDIVVRSMTEGGASRRVFYIDQKIRSKGDYLIIGENKYPIEADTIVVFIDEEPGANWGHRCTYLLYNIHTRAVKEIEGQFPPSFRDVPGTFRLIWKPAGIPSWTLWSDE